VASGAAADGASAHAHAAGHATGGCPDGACRHATRPGHHGVAASRRRQRGSAEAIGDGAEASSVCPQMAAPTAGRGGVARGGPTGGPWRNAGQKLVSAGRQARVEEAHGERLGKSREGLTVGPHAEVSEREEKRAADTWDREGVGVHLAVAHIEREPAERAHDVGQVGYNLLRRK
jgi:hypothetical protein